MQIIASMYFLYVLLQKSQTYSTTQLLDIEKRMVASKGITHTVHPKKYCR